MNTLKKVSIVVLTAVFGFAHFSAQASGDSGHAYAVAENESMFNVSISIQDKELVADTKLGNRSKKMSINPRLTIDWIDTTSIELSDAELIARTGI